MVLPYDFDAGVHKVRLYKSLDGLYCVDVDGQRVSDLSKLLYMRSGNQTWDDCLENWAKAVKDFLTRS